MPSNIRDKAHWLTLLLLEGASAAMLLTLSPYHSGRAALALAEARGRAQDISARLSRYAALGTENEALALANAGLWAENARLRQLADSLGQGRSPRPAQARARLAGWSLLPARVSEATISRADNLIVIDRGARDGVRPEQGVICGTGVVGIVQQAAPGHATVLPVLNSRSSISCRLRRCRHFGYLRWDGGSPLRATLEDVPPHARIHRGEEVETSGFSGIFPEGILVGRVEDARLSPDGQSLSVSVRLSADLSATTRVMVVAGPAPGRDGP